MFNPIEMFLRNDCFGAAIIKETKKVVSFRLYEIISTDIDNPNLILSYDTIGEGYVFEDGSSDWAFERLELSKNQIGFLSDIMEKCVNNSFINANEVKTN